MDVQDPQELLPSDFVAILTLIIAIIFFVVGVFGNLLTIIALLRKTLKIPISYV